MKEVIALAASVTAKSGGGVNFHMREVHRCVDNKIARTLLLDSDFDELI